jgi:hypothetical protein
MSTVTGPAFTTFMERYADSQLDPFQGKYASVMSQFRVRLGIEARGASDALTSKVYETANSMPHAYLIVAYDGAFPYVTMLHRPFCVAPPLGAEEATYYMIFQGDVIDRMPPAAVMFPEKGFVQQRSLRVATLEGLDAICSAGTFTPDMLAGPLVGEEGEIIATRPLAFLPPKYIPLVLANPCMTPIMAYQIIGGAIRSEAVTPEYDPAAACKPLLDWLRAAATLATNASGPAIIPIAMDPGPVPPFPVPAAVVRATKQVLERDLPGLKLGLPHEDGTVAAITHLTGEVVRVHNEGKLAKELAKVKSPESYFGAGGVGILCRITHQSSQESLPSLYHEIAKTSKKNIRVTVEEVLRDASDELGLQGFVPLVTPSLATKLGQLYFAHHNVDDLQAGIHPFITAFRSPSDRTQLQEAIDSYDQLNNGAGAQLADLATIRRAEQAGVPLEMTEVTYAFKSFKVLLLAVLGSNHPLFQAWTAFLSQWVHDEIHLSRAMTAMASMNAAGQMMRWVQIRISNWFTDQVQSTERVKTPDFTDLITRIKNREHWEPGMPPGIGYQMPTFQYPPFPVPGPQHPVPPVPPARIPQPAPAPVASGQTRGNRITNNQYDAEYAVFKELGLPIKDVRDKAKAKNKDIPKNSNGTEFCLSYHVLGFCWDNCNRKEDHRPQSAGDKARSLEWCRTCYREGGPL